MGSVLREVESEMKIFLQEIYEGVPLGSAPAKVTEASLGRSRSQTLMQSLPRFWSVSYELWTLYSPSKSCLLRQEDQVLPLSK